MPEVIGTTPTYPCLRIERTDGAFKFNSVSASTGAVDGYAWNKIGYLSFDARLCSTVYGNSDTVQPPAIQLIPQIKY